MHNTPENLAWATEKLEELQSLPGFPRSDVSLEAVARQFLKIVRNETLKHATLGPVNDVTWLMDLIMSESERFPIPVEMREIYERGFPSADRGELPEIFRVETD